MRRIEAVEVNESFIRAIGTEWMLITAGTLEQGYNMMTASWGAVGFLWNRPIAIVFVRPERYTYEFIERHEAFTLAFLGEEGRGPIRCAEASVAVMSARRSVRD